MSKIHNIPDISKRNWAETSSVEAVLPISVSIPPSPEGITPPSPLLLLDTVSEQLTTPSRKIGAPDPETARWDKRKKRSEKVADALERIELTDRADKMRGCSQTFQREVSRCSHHRTRGKAFPFHCDDRLCPVCAARRSAKVSSRWSRAVERYSRERGVHSYFVTLTVRDMETLPAFGELTKLRKKLLRHRWWKQYGLVGGVSAFELKLGKNSGEWHPHFHILVFTEREIPLIEEGEHKGKWQVSVNQELSDVWREITGDSFILRGVAFDGNMRELVKYCVKGPELLPDDRLKEYALWARGKRFLSAFGECYNNPLIQEAMKEEGEREECCPECGCDEYEVHHFRWSHKHGRYLLERVTVDGVQIPPGST